MGCSYCRPVCCTMEGKGRGMGQKDQDERGASEEA